MPCANCGRTKPRHSSTALALPGRLTISVRLHIPAAARLSMARGVTCIERARIASAMPGASRSMTARVASGVTSRSEKPVPPVVATSARPRSAHSCISFASASSSSGKITRRAMR